MNWWNVAGYTEETCAAAGGTWDPQGFCTHLGFDAPPIVPPVLDDLPAPNPPWEQEARTERKAMIASQKVMRLERMLDGSLPTEADRGEFEYRRARGIVHHRPERAAALGNPVLTEG